MDAKGGSILKSQFVGLDDSPAAVKCLLCESEYILPENQKDFLAHLFTEHRLVIGDISKIASLKSYIYYWRVKLKEEPLTKFCTIMQMDCKPNGEPSKSEEYFLLSDCLVEDKTLRDEIHMAKLEWILSQQTKERTDKDFKRGCMFCWMEFSTDRVLYINHLSEKHNLYLGKPENLVYLDEFFDKIQNTVKSLRCIFCEKLFKDRIALKEHMRKKLHKRINPNNKAYDKFYINNYLEFRKLHKDRQVVEETETVDDGHNEINDEESWSDWNDDDVDISCLFCSYCDKQIHCIFDHMKTEHNFDFQTATKDLTFYQKVKVVNYIRRQMILNRCILCEVTTTSAVEHMNEQDHFCIPPKKIWDQPEYYFPICENDPFLYHLDEDSSHSEAAEINNVGNRT